MVSPDPLQRLLELRRRHVLDGAPASLRLSSGRSICDRAQSDRRSIGFSSCPFREDGSLLLDRALQLPDVSRER